MHNRDFRPNIGTFQSFTILVLCLFVWTCWENREEKRKLLCYLKHWISSWCSIVAVGAAVHSSLAAWLSMCTQNTSCMFPLCNRHPLSVHHVTLSLLIRLASLLVVSLNLCSSLCTVLCCAEFLQMSPGRAWSREAKLLSDWSSDAANPGSSRLDCLQGALSNFHAQKHQSSTTTSCAAFWLRDIPLPTKLV